MDAIFSFRQLGSPQFIMNKTSHQRTGQQGHRPVKIHHYFIAAAFIKKKKMQQEYSNSISATHLYY